MNVVLLSPGYPSEMPEFARGLAEVDANVIGVGDQLEAALPDTARRALSAYVRVSNLFDELRVVKELKEALGDVAVDRVECLWEPLMVLTARVRQAFECPGLTVDATVPFRDKEKMKQVLDAAGIRTPRHVACSTASECWEAAEQIGFPVIIKPIAGAGSADTYRVDTPLQLREVLGRIRHVPVVSVEEFVEGEEFTFDTVTIDGKIAFYSIAVYRPRPLVARSNEWISPQVIALKDPDAPYLFGGKKMGFDVIEALGFQTGFTHMEWYRKADGEVVFGEIGARPPGARQVDQMNLSCDFDVFTEWGRAVCYGELKHPAERRYNVATIFKRAQGQGVIRHIEGADRLRHDLGDALMVDALLPVGARRRNWLNTLLSDGYWILRHPSLKTTMHLADRVGTELRLYAS